MKYALARAQDKHDVALLSLVANYFKSFWLALGKGEHIPELIIVENDAGTIFLAFSSIGKGPPPLVELCFRLIPIIPAYPFVDCSSHSSIPTASVGNEPRSPLGVLAHHRDAGGRRKSARKSNGHSVRFHQQRHSYAHCRSVGGCNAEIGLVCANLVRYTAVNVFPMECLIAKSFLGAYL